MKNIIFTILLTSTIWSCGTRKVNKSETSIVTEVKDTTETKVNAASTDVTIKETEKHETENTSWDETTGTITPSDPEKPMSITDKDGNKTTFENATVNFGKNTGTSAHDTTEKVIEQSVKKDTLAVVKSTGHSEKSEAKTDVKITERIQSYWWVLLIVIGLITLYLMINRKKSA